MKVEYIRVSKHEQHEDLQRDTLAAAKCEKYLWTSSPEPRRQHKGLEEALAYLRPRDTFVVWKLDRAGRSLAHLIELLKNLQNREISFVSLTEQIDTTTPSGKLIFHLMAALADFERDLIRERTNAGLAAARARGNVGGRPRKLQSNAKVALARQLFASKEHPIPESCAALGISRATLYRYVKETEPPA
ncbi:resolvase [Dictyobacter alpinus]|uniref:Resolvase n=1 Tax=Dictyobacter alpinus TaxID=2014873 RepID=A0A402BE52_9CHLR|nr:recombinase family protein [Dictyobacter alpinus]GCE29572.1 resolvase [Dictyobacter alpinus]